MYPDLYLMRHGQTEWNAEGRMQGRLDSPLTQLGIAQAQAQNRLIRGVEATCYASTLGRARQTAQIVFGDRPYQLDDRLVEISIGAFSGMLYSDLVAAKPGVFQMPGLGWYDHAPGGEGFAGLTARVRDFLDSLTGPALIVTHGITLRMMRMLAMGWDMSRFEDLPQYQGAVQVIRDGQHEIWREDG
ncbi:histidine phosphatase family protein [Paracoccus sp. M683]|uniref:histidine phosphatase family protein n=1 Tax=Paracoccus sp. M683 TaxID=2594268 RepID=UPI00117FB8CD|nr:histidine phosphatase family protein [Paracoccus sp. M683]TRW98224.1 histidine phosphatase family protein [Paracoccus sp. M683]